MNIFFDMFSQVKIFVILRGHFFADDPNSNFSRGNIFADACIYRHFFQGNKKILLSKYTHELKHDDQIFLSKLQQMK